MGTSMPYAGYKVGNVGFFTPPDTYDPQADSRGILWIWELPQKDARYVLSCDPTVGKIGWSIWNRDDSDRSIDNAAIEVIRLGNTRIEKDAKGEQTVIREPDVQVAEWAAPIDPTTCARVINAIGKLYRGDSEDEGCLVNFEVGPGPGIAVFPELYSNFGYTNIFQQPYLDSPRPKRQIDYGFWATQQSKQLLWTKGVRHMWLGGLNINSPWLLEEAIDATSDKFVFKTARSRIATQDDRFTAALLGIWALHSWTMNADEATPTHLSPIALAGNRDSQKMLVTATEAHMTEQDIFAKMMDGLVGVSDMVQLAPSPSMQKPSEEDGGLSSIDVFSEQ